MAGTNPSRPDDETVSKARRIYANVLAGTGSAHNAMRAVLTDFAETWIAERDGSDQPPHTTDDEVTPHVYTVDVILHGSQPYPCVICGRQRQALIHNAPIAPHDTEQCVIPYPGMDPHDSVGRRCGWNGNGCHRRDGHPAESVYTRYDDDGELVETVINHVKMVAGAWVAW